MTLFLALNQGYDQLYKPLVTEGTTHIDQEHYQVSRGHVRRGRCFSVLGPPCNKTPQTGWVRQQKFVLTFSETESPRSGCPQVWFLRQPLSVAGGWLPSRGLSSAHGNLWCLFMFLRGPVIPNEGLSLINSSNLNDFFKGPNTVTLGGQGCNIRIWEGCTIQAITGGFERG